MKPGAYKDKSAARDRSSDSGVEVEEVSQQVVDAMDEVVEVRVGWCVISFRIFI